MSSERASFFKSRDFRLAICLSGNAFLFVGFALNLPLFFEDWKREFEASSSAISVINSISGGIGPALSLFASFAFNAGLKPWVAQTIAGAVFGVSLTAASWASSLWTLVIVGSVIPFACSPLVMLAGYVAVAQQAQERHRHLCNVVFVTGVGAGKLGMAYLLAWLRQEFTWRGAFLIAGGLGFNICVLARLTILAAAESAAPRNEAAEPLRPRKNQPEKSRRWNLRKIVDVSLLFDRKCQFLLAAKVTAWSALISFNVYIIPFSVADIGVAVIDAASLQSIASAFQILGSVSTAVLGRRSLAPRWRPALLAASFGCFGVVACSAPLATRWGHLLAIVGLGGLFTGMYTSLFPSSIGDIFGRENYQKVHGFCFCLGGYVAIAVPPLIGIHVDRRGSYSEAFFFSGGLFFFAAVAMSVVARLFASASSGDGEIGGGDGEGERE